MSVAFGTSLTVLPYTWTVLKATLASKGITSLMQYYDDGDTYTVFVVEAQTLVHTTTIWKGTVPDGVISGGYSQATNDADKSDFETNYKPTANGPLTATTTRTPGYTATTNTTTTPLRATFYTEQTTGAQRSVSSSSASDTSAGTGARTIKITYYDATLTNLKTETVALNGTSAVNTVATDICFIERIDVITVGSGGGNVGTLTLFISTAGGGGTIGTVSAGDNQTNWCHHYVRVNRTAYILGGDAGCKGASSGSITIRKAFPTASPAQAELVIASQFRVPAGGEEHFNFSSAPLAVAGPARVTLYAQQDAASGTNTWFAGFGFFEN